MSAPPRPPSRLKRELGTFDAVIVGLGSMIGAGVRAAHRLRVSVGRPI